MTNKEKQIQITRKALLKHLLTAAELDLMIDEIDGFKYDYTLETDKDEILGRLKEGLTQLQEEWPDQTETDLKGFIQEGLEIYDCNMQEGFEYVEIGIKEILETIGRGLIKNLSKFYANIGI